MRAFAVLAAVAAVAAGCGGGGGDATVCRVEVVDALPPKHLTDLNAKPKYNTDPPTSGPHYYLPAKWNMYSFPIPQVALVHNLEHGGVVVQYGKDVPKETVEELRRWYLKDSNGLVVAPLPRLGDEIVLGAWNAPPYKQGVDEEQRDPGKGYLARCSGFDAAEFTAFVAEHRYKAGERLPAALLKRNPS